MRAQSTIYLGTEINAAADPTLEVQRRMAEVCVTWKKLDTFWKHSNTPTKIKIQIYDAVIRSKLVYGLESLQLTKAWQNRINAFQLKGLRKILRFKSTYIDRRQTNAKIYDTCTRIIQRTPKTRKPKPTRRTEHTKDTATSWKSHKGKEGTWRLEWQNKGETDEYVLHTKDHTLANNISTIINNDSLTLLNTFTNTTELALALETGCIVQESNATVELTTNSSRIRCIIKKPNIDWRKAPWSEGQPHSHQEYNLVEPDSRQENNLATQQTETRQDPLDPAFLQFAERGATAGWLISWKDEGTHVRIRCYTTDASQARFMTIRLQDNHFKIYFAHETMGEFTELEHDLPQPIDLTKSFTRHTVRTTNAVLSCTLWKKDHSAADWSELWVPSTVDGCTETPRSSADLARRIKPFTEYFADKAQALLGHVLRAPATDPLRQVTFRRDTATPQLYPKNRTGRPKHNWIIENLQRAWLTCVNNRDWITTQGADPEVIRGLAIPIWDDSSAPQAAALARAAELRLI